MNNKLKKAISIFTATAAITAALSLSALSYADESYEDTIYISSFSDYESDGTPNGWVISKYMVNNKTEVENIESFAHADYEDSNNILKINNQRGQIKDIIPFGKIISSDKLKISYDFKIPKTDNKTKADLVLFNTQNVNSYNDNTIMKNYNFNDVMDLRGAVGQQQTHILTIPYNSSEALVSNSGMPYCANRKTQLIVEPLKWIHIDVEIDLNKNIYDVWIDGEKLARMDNEPARIDANYNRYKGMAFLLRDGSINEGLYDNIFVTHYRNDSSINLVADDLYTLNEKFYTELAFSEYLDRTPENGDFVITDSYTGETVDYEVESGDGRHAILKINTDKAAKLNIAFSEESNLCGTISSRLSAKKASVFTNIKQGETVVPVLDEVSAVDYNGNSVKLDGSEVVPIGTTTADISFSTPVSLDGIQDKVYIQKADSDEKLDVNYTVADDNKSVKMNFAELMSADSDYKLVISDTVSSYANENVFLPHSYEYSFRTSNDGGFGIFGDKITVDEGEGTAVFSANIIKSDENSYKGTIIICGYSDEEVDGKVYSKLEKVDVQKYDIEINSITAYETKPIDITGLNRIKCYITDTVTHKLLLISEMEF